MTIAEVSQKYDLSVDTLRYYERIGLIPKVRRTSGGIRDYSPEDCGWVEFAKCMRNAGLPIEALIEYVNLYLQGEDTRTARKQILMEQRDELAGRIAQMQATLKRLDYKIENYHTTFSNIEKGLIHKKRLPESDFFKI